ncbi:MAG TPA: cytochrome oxidase assembly protein [Gammaproteobacteria bacterium]|nr:cytochrome oxidase assembly protein [Gammaproteobacteria bacterium]
MAQNETDPTREAARRRLIPLVLFLLFLGPLVLAAILYLGGPEFRPRETVNHGELIQPPVLLPALEHADGTLLRDVWTLVYLDDGSCGAACRAALQDTRQVRLALGREGDRVRRLLFESGQDALPDDLADQHPDLVVVRVGPGEADLLEAFPAPGEASGQAAGRIYLVDPLGNLMMRYPPDTDPGGLLEDLERLLRLSRIG